MSHPCPLFRGDPPADASFCPLASRQHNEHALRTAAEAEAAYYRTKAQAAHGNIITTAILCCAVVGLLLLKVLATGRDEWVLPVACVPAALALWGWTQIGRRRSRTAPLVGILEDDPGRIAEMRAVLAEAMPEARAMFFDHANTMIAWLAQPPGQVILISLDHDLPFGGTDCGTGRQVADYLASMPPSCPVIIHSSNDQGASGMYFALKRAGWAVSRVYPCDDLAWIGIGWAEQVAAVAPALPEDERRGFDVLAPGAVQPPGTSPDAASDRGAR